MEKLTIEQYIFSLVIKGLPDVNTSEHSFIMAEETVEISDLHMKGLLMNDLNKTESKGLSRMCYQAHFEKRVDERGEKYWHKTGIAGLHTSSSVTSF